MSDRATQRDLVLHRLQQGSATIWDLTVSLRISRPGARIFELKKKHNITDEWKDVQGRRVKVYTLHTSGGSQSSRRIRSQAFYAYTCEECGAQFDTKKQKARFCKASCRAANWKRKKAILGIEAQQSLEFSNERLRSEREWMA